MAGNSYKSKVRIGNWYENILNEEVQKEYEDKKVESQNAYKTALESFFKEEEVSCCPDNFIHFGNKLVLHVPSTTLNKGGPLERKGKVTIGISPTSNTVNKNLSLSGTCITASPIYHTPCYRNVFTILPRLASQSDDDVLCYGEVFELAFVTHENEIFYVTSPPGCAFYSNRNSRRQEVLLEDDISPYSAWRIVPNKPQGDELLTRKPVEVEERVNILQMMTNQPLVVEEEYSIKTVFGQEPDVSVGEVTRATTRASPVFTLLTSSSFGSKSSLENDGNV